MAYCGIFEETAIRKGAFPEHCEVVTPAEAKRRRSLKIAEERKDDGVDAVG